MAAIYGSDMTKLYHDGTKHHKIFQYLTYLMQDVMQIRYRHKQKVKYI